MGGVHAARADSPAVRRCVLAICVLDDVDLTPTAHGVRVGRALVGWDEVAGALGPGDPQSADGRRRVARLLRLHARAGADAGSAAGVLSAACRLVALPAEHVDHLGPSWVREQLLGGALDLGLGVLGLLDDPDAVVPLPPGVAQAAGLPVQDCWNHARRHAEHMGALAAARLTRDGGTGGGGVLRPVGGCDVLALLASRTLRDHLAGGDGSGLRALAAPVRNRGWFDLARIDPAFVVAAWTATPPVEQGLPVPLLVTRDEVTRAVPGDGLTRQALGG